MRYHRTVVLALLVCTFIGAGKQNACAQARFNRRYAQNTPAVAPAAAAPTRGNVEELPMGQPAQGQFPGASESGPYYNEGFQSDHFMSGGPAGACGCPDACCDACNGPPCGEPCCNFEGCGSGGCGSGVCGGCGGWGGGTWFVNADYLAVRAHFSESLAWMQQTLTQDATSTTTVQDFHQLDYDFESSFRVGGGYKLCCCGEEIAFNFTRFKSSADDFLTAPDRNSGIDIFVPFEPAALNPDDPQSVRVRSSVNVDSYDLEWRKTIPLGGTTCSDCGSTCGCGECGNACGCGDCCGTKCPAWDITWSGGVRVADVDWNRAYFITDPVDDTLNTDTHARLSYDGVGPRFGVEGRRYFGRDGWFSVFLKGDISLLLGELELDDIRHSIVNDTNVTVHEHLRSQQMIPVTEIEAGASAAVTCHSTISAGYMLSAWHDLGMRDQPFVDNVELITHYDDANIMSFDGVFARFEWNY